MIIRAAQRGDRAAIETVVASAFDEPLDGPTVRLVRSLDATGATRASLVAEDAGEIAGHVHLSRGWVDARQRLVEVLVLGPLSVSPGHQGKGVGTRLVAAAIQAADEQAAPALFLEGPWEYYGPRGFRPARSLGFLPPSARIPGPAFQVATLSTYEPWMTGGLVYCEAFWANDAVGLRDPRLARAEARLRAAFGQPADRGE